MLLDLIKNANSIYNKVHSQSNFNYTIDLTSYRVIITKSTVRISTSNDTILFHLCRDIKANIEKPLNAISYSNVEPYDSMVYCSSKSDTNSIRYEHSSCGSYTDFDIDIVFNFDSDDEIFQYSTVCTDSQFTYIAKFIKDNKNTLDEFKKIFPEDTTIAFSITPEHDSIKLFNDIILYCKEQLKL